MIHSIALSLLSLTPSASTTTGLLTAHFENVLGTSLDLKIIASSEAAVKQAEANGTRPKDGAAPKKPSTGSKTLDASRNRVDKVTSELPTGISKQSSTTLTNYAKLNENGKAKFNADPKNKLALHQAQYEQNKLSGKLTAPADLKAQQSLAKEAITSKYSQDVLDFYGLSNTQKQAYFKQDPTTAQKLYDQSKQLDKELTGNGGTTKYTKTGGIKIAKPKAGKKLKLPSLAKAKTSTPASTKVSYKAPKSTSLKLPSLTTAKAAAPKIGKVTGRKAVATRRLPKIANVKQSKGWV